MWRSKQAGFTLVELLIVFSLLGLSMSLVVPLGLEQLEKFEKKADEKTLSGFVIAVQKYAFWTNKAQILKFNSDSVLLLEDEVQIKRVDLKRASFPEGILKINPNGIIETCVSPDDFSVVLDSLSSEVVCNEVE